MSQSDRNVRFFDALKNGDDEVLTEEFGGVRKALIDYLVYTRGADRAGAEDAVSVAFLKALEAIRNNKIEKKESLYSWLLQASRTIYRDEKNKVLNKILDKSEFNEEHHPEPEEQVDLMYDPERQRLLKICLDKLTEDMRITIDYFMKFPEVSLEKASKKLKVSYITLRRRKSRITHQLHNCVQELMGKT